MAHAHVHPEVESNPMIHGGGPREMPSSSNVMPVEYEAETPLLKKGLALTPFPSHLLLREN